MKNFLFTVSLLFVALCITAQTEDEYSWYLDKAKEQLAKGECEKAERNYNHYKNLAHDSLPQLDRQIQECLRIRAQASQKVDTEIVFVPVQVTASESKAELIEEPKKENKFKDFLKDRDNPYCKAERNRYIAWAVVCAGYPWNLGMDIELRGGGILGIGGYADVGMDFSTISCNVKYVDQYITNVHSYETNVLKISFMYNGGVRLFYKGVFLSFGYGSVARVNPAISLEYYATPGGDDVVKTDARERVHNGHGVRVNVGYNLVAPSADGFFLGVSGGFAYDIVNKVVVPSFNLKLGMSFEWKKY